MPEAVVEVAGRDEPLEIRINGPNPTFWIASDRISAQAVSELDTRLLDLLDIAAAVFAADGTIKRGGPTRPSMGNGWRRGFHFRIQVRNVALWGRPDVLEALTGAVEFLTEDSVRFSFEQAVVEPVLQPYLDLDPDGAVFKADEVILFSGGLDSFAGALEVLATTSAKFVLVTHRSAQKAIPRQVELGEYLSDRFPGRVLHLHVPAHRVGAQAADSTQRSRAFLFAALGQVVAHAFGAGRVSFFENGIISHNLPLTPQIVGSMATRTTHPLTLTKLNTLMRLVEPQAVPIENRYRWMTKTEVVRRIAENGAANLIPKTVSCTSIREQTRRHTHCGACSQCLDRRFAILAAGLDAHDFADDYETDVLFGERTRDASKTMALEWTRHSMRLGQLDERGFVDEFGLELTRIVRGHPELPRKTAVEFTLDLHRRHSNAVRRVLERVLRERTDDLVGQRIPATSLVAMYLGQVATPEAALDADPRVQAARPESILGGEETDIVPDPDAPLRVEFLEEGGRHVVAVHGLGRVIGQPARIPHSLKPAFDEDKANGVAADDHRYIEPTRLPLLEGMSKDAVRQNVGRCRKRLAEDFEALHGKPPDRDLLVQGRPPKGIRLDPFIEIAPPNRSN